MISVATKCIGCDRKDIERLVANEAKKRMKH